MMVHISEHWKAQAGSSLSSRLVCSTKFQDSRSYIEKPCFKKKKRKRKITDNFYNC